MWLFIPPAFYWLMFYPPMWSVTAKLEDDNVIYLEEYFNDQLRSFYEGKYGLGLRLSFSFVQVIKYRSSFYELRDDYGKLIKYSQPRCPKTGRYVKRK